MITAYAALEGTKQRSRRNRSIGKGVLFVAGPSVVGSGCHRKHSLRRVRALVPMLRSPLGMANVFDASAA